MQHIYYYDLYNIRGRYFSTSGMLGGGGMAIFAQNKSTMVMGGGVRHGILSREILKALICIPHGGLEIWKFDPFVFFSIFSETRR